MTTFRFKPLRVIFMAKRVQYNAYETSTGLFSKAFEADKHTAATCCLLTREQYVGMYVFVCACVCVFRAICSRSGLSGYLSSICRFHTA